MKNLTKYFWAGALAVLLFIGEMAAEPSVSNTELDRLRNFPFSVSQKQSLIIRSRHVDSVHFFGASYGSRFGYSHETGLAPESLWLELRLQGTEPFSRGSITFEEGLDVMKYNSLVLWVRALNAKKKLYIGFDDAHWTKKEILQSHSIIFPTKGLPRNKIYQVVIPLSLLRGQILDMSHLKHLNFEYGKSTVGNAPTGSIEVIGLAFVRQEKQISKILILDTEESVKSEGPPRRTRTRAALPTTILPAKRTEEKQRKIEPSPTPAPEKHEKINVASPFTPVIRERPEQPAVSPPKKVNPSHLKTSLNFIVDEISTFAFLAGLFVFGGLLLASVYRFRGHLRPRKFSRGKCVTEVKWPFVGPPAVDGSKVELQFWKDLRNKNVHTAWLSPFGISLKRISEEDIHGEQFLFRQVRNAREAGIVLYPSLCFARTVFNFEAFLENPKLYFIKYLSSNDLHLSDEELRLKYIGFFPLWIPPFWQKKQGLPQRLMLTYGKLPGVMATNDSVQYNLNMPELRQVAIRVLEKFAQVTRGVRIEGTSALLNASLSLYWNRQFFDAAHPEKTEFWSEVITAVKSNYPEFLFMADAAGHEAERLVELGFDYFENDHLQETLVNQIRTGTIGALEFLLNPVSKKILHKSVYNISALVKATQLSVIHAKQNALACMILSLLPGFIEKDGNTVPSLDPFFSLINGWIFLKSAGYLYLRTNTPEILAFARWEGKALCLVISNLSKGKKDVKIYLEKFKPGFEGSKLYLFNDMLHGTTPTQSGKKELSGLPVLAALGEDLVENGLSLSVSELSLRLLSVNLTTPLGYDIISGDISPKIHELHKA